MNAQRRIVTQSRVSCDCGGGALGLRKSGCRSHPILRFVECGYCDKRFVLKEVLYQAPLIQNKL